MHSLFAFLRTWRICGKAKPNQTADDKYKEQQKAYDQPSEELHSIYTCHMAAIGEKNNVRLFIISWGYYQTYSNSKPK